MESVRRYGEGPFHTILLHGGPGAQGEMRPVAVQLSKHFGVLEFLQTEHSIEGLMNELYRQMTSTAKIPATLIGYSWGAWLGFLFAGRYPRLVRKLILVSSGAFESRYNKDLMKKRMDRLNSRDREEANRLISQVNSGQASNELLRSLGDLMAKADSYDLEPDDAAVNIDIQAYKMVWTEASKMRDDNQLLTIASYIRCPVVAIHGDHDPHPAAGVEEPLSTRLSDFRMILIRQCGHIPWKEKKAKDTFYQVLHRELT